MKLYLRTFGCRANQYDSEAVRAMIEASGGTIVSAPEAADVAVFNSCAVTSDAVADLRQQVRRAARANPALRSVVMGCASALPAGPGLEIVEAVCTGCHETNQIARSPGYTRDGWAELAARLLG